METTRDQIQSVCKKAFKHHSVDWDGFCRDIICFDEIGTRCAAVFDDTKLSNTFVVVCLGITLEREWKLVKFEIRRNGSYDGIDAMNLAHNYIDDKDWVRCRYPMNMFYNFEQEVPANTRVSRPSDCEKCMEENCDDKHCLIVGKHEDKFPPK
jgi:hypothetical protein